MTGMLLPTAHCLTASQAQAVDNVERLWKAGTDRALVVMPTGSGKTATAAHCAARVLTPGDILIVFVPSRALIPQTIIKYQDELDISTTVAAASNVGLVRAQIAEQSAVTDPDLLAVLLHARDRSAVTLLVATYHSATVVAQAQESMRDTEAFRVCVYDEAHHLAGEHKYRFLPAVTQVRCDYRLHLTGTPLTLGDAEPGWIPTTGSICMTDTATFGPVAYHLTMGQARKAGVVTPWRVMVRTPDDETTDSMAGAVQVLRSAAQEQHVRRVAVYLNRVSDCHRFADLLHAAGPLHDGTPVYAHVITGDTPNALRYRTLERLNATTDSVEVVVNVNLLTEGIDVPRLDTVMFAANRESRVSVTQILGRVIRPYPGKSHGTILLPVTRPPEGDGDQSADSESFAGLWETLQALRDCDAEFASALDARLSPRPVARKSPSTEPECVVDLPDDLAQYVRLLHTDPAESRWNEMFNQVATELQAGTPLADLPDVLKTWCVTQRARRLRGHLPLERADALSSLPGWYWASAFRATSPALRALVSSWPSSGLAEPADRAAKVPGWTTSRGTLAAWVRLARRRGRLTREVEHLVTQLPNWQWSLLDPDVEEVIDALDRFRAWEGHVTVPPDHVERGIPLGRWMAAWERQRSSGTLELAIDEEIQAAARGTWKPRKEATPWEVKLAVLHHWYTTAGPHAQPRNNIPSEHGTHPVATWIATIRSQYHRGVLPAARIRQVEEIPGWQWVRPKPRPRRKRLASGQHGTRSAYVAGCRCTDCRQANRTYAVTVAKRITQTGVSTTLIDADPAREKLQHLVEAGIPVKTVARYTRISTSSLQKLAQGSRERITPETWERLSALEPATMIDDIIRQTQEGQRGYGPLIIDGSSTWQLIEDLLAAGYTKTWIARNAGLGSSIQLQRDRVSVKSAAAIRTLHTRATTGLTPAVQETTADPSPTVATA